MEKPQSVDLRICFDTKYSHTTLGVIYDNKKIHLDKGKTFVNVQIKSIDQLVDLEFFGFTPDDKVQKIKIIIFYKNKHLDTTSLCTFYMKDNKFVSNTVLEKYNEIHFNGILHIQFFKQWFECNLLSGAYITNEKRFLHRWVLGYGNHKNLRSVEHKEYDIFCVGCSVTFGMGLEPQHTWPQVLAKELDCSVANFGVQGMSIHGCLRQILFCVNNLDAKKIVVLLPSFERIFHKFKFLENNAYFNFTMSRVESDYKIFDKKAMINRIYKHSVRQGKRIIECLVKMNQSNRRIFLTSWAQDVYDAIPQGDFKLPQPPALNTFKERAYDGHYPHYKHMKLFVEFIKDQIDKT